MGSGARPRRAIAAASSLARPALIAAALIALAACGGTAGSATPGASEPGTSASASAGASEGRTWRNPVYPFDFPDPHVLRVGTDYYAYSTNAGTSNIPVIRSTDLARWKRVGDALPALPAWAQLNFGNAWAPGVIALADDDYRLFFVARDREGDRQCIGVARGTDPTGPFADESERALVCQLEIGGSIDPYPFRDADGSLWLLWKNDGNCCAKQVSLWAQRLAPDAMSLVGEPTLLISRDRTWELPLIENPALVRADGRYYLFYSANWWAGPDYAVGYAVCETVTGPCRKPVDGPIFRYSPEATGPGGEAFFDDPAGNLWMAYHAWTGAAVGYPGGLRTLRLERLSFAAGAPVIDGPTTDPQPLP